MFSIRVAYRLPGDEAKYHGYVFLGPYEEKIAGKLRGVYKGVYRKGVKEVWGKMVGFFDRRNLRTEHI